jgi:phosphoglycolate phosphatase-like HAD superfamily hydrolase
MRAVIFDIDGTLIHSNQLDDEMYLAAVTDVLGKVSLRKSWGLYKNLTGAGTLVEVLADNAIPHTEAVIEAVERAFVGRIANHIERHGPIPELSGARAFVEGLSRRPDCCIAYATAGWRAAAQLKLDASGFPVEGVPLSSCNDHLDKHTIMLHALETLGRSFDSVTYYGDGERDKVAAHALGWQFVAVGEKLNGLRHFSLEDVEA